MTMILEAANKYYSKLHSDLHAIKDYIKHNPGIFLTVLYLLGSFSGVVYLATLLNKFSINAFHHIELSDFLLALVTNPILVIMYTIFLSVVVIGYNWELKRIPDPKKPTLWKKIYHGSTYPIYLLNPSYFLFTVIFLVLCSFSAELAHNHSKSIQDKKTQSYSLSLNDPIQQKKAILLTDVQIVTSTSRNLFIYDNRQEKLLIIPQNNIAAVVPTIKDKNPEKAKAATKKTIKETKKS